MIMKLLAIDTSTDYLSLAVINDDKIRGRIHRKAPMSHSNLLIPMIDRLLKKTKMRLKDIDAFSISIGPGSFTGLRIGVTTVKGLAYSLKKPIVAVPTLDVIAHNARNFIGTVCPVLDAKKNKVYACLYKSNGKDIKRISKYLLLPVQDLVRKIKDKKVLFLGDAVEQIFRVMRGPGCIKNKEKCIADWHPRAEVVAKLGSELLRKGKVLSPEDLEPLYLYSKECDIKGV